MAITKILCIDAVDNRNPAKHLQQALDYIQNPEKTEEQVLVGSINCPPETAFEQMMDTKQLFGKTGKRQGYHIIIAFPPGEATQEQAFEITRRFAEEYLGDQYEVVFSVHTDKEHMHGHVIWNSVNMMTGKKFNCPKGEWKHKMQPITNRLCEEFGLSIMPAEYSKNPVNLPRKQWEYEQTFKEMILRDAKFCAAYAGSMEHFQFLMKRLGYDFKKKEYLTVKMPGRKLYHKLDKMDEIFSKEQFQYSLKYSYTMLPHYYSQNPTYHKRPYMTPYQKKYYGKMYRLRMIEQKRFYVGSAKYTEDLRKFHQVQDEYLFLCKNHIESFHELLDYHTKQEERWNEIDSRQKDIYKQNSVSKRACKSEGDWREYQNWHLGIEKELDILKDEKKEVKYQQKLAKNCIYEQLDTAIGVIDEDELVIGSGYLDVPVFEGEMMHEEVVEENRNEPDVLIEGTSDQELFNVKFIQEKVNESNIIDTPIEIRKVLHEEEIDQVTDSIPKIIQEIRGELPETYAKYNLLSVEERAELFAISDVADVFSVFKSVQQYFKQIGHSRSLNEIMDEANLIYDAVRQIRIRKEADRICSELQNYGLPYSYITTVDKAKLFAFRLDDNNYNLALHSAVLNKLGISKDFDERYEDYQKIYEASLGGQERNVGRDRER